MAIAIRHGGRGHRRECESCRVQSRQPGLAFCANCGHAFGSAPVPAPSPLAAVVPHPVLQMIEQRADR